MNKEFLKIDIEKIKSYPKNNKKHWLNIKEIKKSIKQNWYIAPIIIDEDNIILAWHWRHKALQELWKKEIKCLNRDFDFSKIFKT